MLKIMRNRGTKNAT